MSADGGLFGEAYDPAALSGTGRYLTETELFAWTRFLDAGRLLEEVLARHVADHHQMTHSDYEVLVRLDGAGGSMRMTVLAGLVVSSAPKLTHTVNRLQQRGWVDRVPVAADGRGLVAQLTPTGREALAAAASGHAALIRQFLIDELSTDEQQIIGTAFERVSSHLRTHRRGEPCPRCDERAAGSPEGASVSAPNPG